MRIRATHHLRPSMRECSKKERLLDIIKNFILFSIASNSRFKVLAAYHQYFAVHKAIEKAKIATKTDGKGGVFGIHRDL